MSTQPELERQRKAAEKAAKERHLQARAQEVEQLNQVIAVKIQSLETLLESSLKNSDDPAKILASLVGLHDVPPLAERPPDRPPHKSIFESMVPEPGLAEKFTGIGKSKRLDLAKQAEQKYEQAVAVYNKQRAEYDAKVLARENEVKERQEAYNSFHSFLVAKHPKAVGRYFELALKRSAYPAGFPRSSRLSYNSETGEMVLEYDLPKYEDIIPTLYLCTFRSRGEKWA